MKAPEKPLGLLAVVLAGAVGMALGPVPGKWVVPDGSQVTQKPPPIANTNLAFIENNGPDQVVVTSQGTTATATLVLDPDGVSVAFTMPAGARKIVISDAHVNGAKAVGTLFWGKAAAPKSDDPNSPSGGIGGI